MQKLKIKMGNLPIEIIERKIYLIRGHKVMLDSDLARLYQVSVKRLNEAIKRNANRFPKDFMFQLNKDEIKNLRYQFGTSNLRSQFATSSYGGRRYLPYAFTKHGVAMLSSVLKSKRAVEVNILIIRAFIKIREMLSAHKDIVAEIEKMKIEQKKHSEQILAIMNVINRLNEKKKKKNDKMGFQPKD